MSRGVPAAPRADVEATRLRAWRGATEPGTDDPDARTWFGAYRAAATGAFDEAEEAARALLGRDAWAVPARITLGSVLRQTARHAEAASVDSAALGAATDDVGRTEALISLAADAIGAADARLAADHLERAERARLLTDRRSLVRASWVRTELALLTADAVTAVGAARLALADARGLDWPRHIAKSHLFLGAALEAARSAEAGRHLREAVERARAIGAAPIADVAAGLLTRAG